MLGSKIPTIEKMLQRMAALHPALHVAVKREDGSGLHKIHWWGRQEKAKLGNFRNWIKSKIIDTYFFYRGGCRRVDSQ